MPSGGDSRSLVFPGSLTYLCRYHQSSSCASSLELKTRGPKKGARSALIMVNHIFSSPARHAKRCGKEKVLDQFTGGTSSSMTKPAESFLREQCRCTCMSETAPIVPIDAQWRKDCVEISS